MACELIIHEDDNIHGKRWCTTHHSYLCAAFDKLTAKRIADMNEPILVDDVPSDNVNQPSHYTSHPSGVECIEIVEHFGYCIGNAIKYLWRAGLKHDLLEDLRKAEYYIKREIARREASPSASSPAASATRPPTT